MNEITASDIRKWQSELIKQGYAPTYLKTINNQLAALFNYAVRYYDLPNTPCRKAGSMGKGKADEMNFTKSYQRMGGRDVITEPKTPKSKRVIAIPQFLVVDLQDYVNSMYGVQGEDRLFPIYKILFGT